MELPRHLQKWSASLELFSEELQIALGDMVRHLSYLVGPLNDSREQGDLQVNGYDGIINRGHYDNLLLSEWLLAKEIPMEFSRRVVMGEQLFLKPHWEHTEGARISLAIFDTGPSQLGLPRLAQLALLIVLERRARQYHADFQFSYYHRGNEQPFEFLGKQSIEHMLAARTLEMDSKIHEQYWQQRLDELKQKCEVWVISPRKALSAGQHRLCHINISEVMEPETRLLSITIDKAGKKKQATLSLPSDSITTQLIRHPFATDFMPHKSQRVNNVHVDFSPAAESVIVFSRSGRRFVLEVDLQQMDKSLFDYQQGVAMYGISQNDKMIRPSNLYVKGQRIVACTVRRRKIMSLTANEEYMYMDHLPKGISGKIRTDSAQECATFPLQELHYTSFNGEIIVHLMKEGVLYRFEWRDGAELEVVNDNVLSTFFDNECLSWFATMPKSSELALFTEHYQPRNLMGGETSKVVVGNLIKIRPYYMAGFAQQQGKQWRLYEEFPLFTSKDLSYSTIEVLDKFVVKGVVRLRKIDSPHVFMKEMKQDSNFLVSYAKGKLALQAGSFTTFIELPVDNIVQVWVNTYIPEVVLLDAKKSLHVYSIERDRVLGEFTS